MVSERGSDTTRRSSDWDVRFGRRNFLSLGGSHIVVAALALGTVWLLTRELGTTNYGRLTAVIAISMLLTQLAATWHSAALVRFGCDEFIRNGDLRASFWTRGAMLALAQGVSVLVFWSFSSDIARWMGVPGAGLLVLAHFVTLSLSLHSHVSLQAAKLPRFQGLLLVVERALLLAVVLTLSYFGRLSWSAVGWSYVVVAVASSCLALGKLGRLVWPPERPKLGLASSMLSFSAPLILQTLFGYLSTNYVDAFFILHFLSAQALGLYTLAFQFSGSFLQIATVAGSLVLPYLISLESTDAREKQEKYVEEVLPSLAWVWGLACTVAAAATAGLLPTVFPESFRSSSELLWPLFAAASIAGPMMLGFGPLALARSLPRVSATLAGISAVTNVVLNAALMPSFGLLGCVWATTAAYFMATFAGAVLLSRLLGFNCYRSLTPMLPPVLAAVVVGLSKGEPSGTAFAMLIAGAAFVLVGLRLRRPLRGLLRTGLRGLPVGASRSVAT